MSLEFFSIQNQEKEPDPTIGFGSIETAKLERDIKEFIFHEIITSKIIDSYENKMIEIGFSSDQIDEFREEIINLSLDDREAMYAFPWELKQRAMPSFLKKIKEQKDSIHSMVNKIINSSKIQHRKIAYHSSNENIEPKYERSNGRSVESWVIYGREKDHRDNDLPMAYYSFDYENLYRIKNPRYIYIISIQEGEQFGHRKDGNNEWGRAPSLSVIEKIDLKEVDEMVKELTKEEIKKIINKNITDDLAA